MIGNYNEDELVQKTMADYLEKALGWRSVVVENSDRGAFKLRNQRPLASAATSAKSLMSALFRWGQFRLMRFNEVATAVQSNPSQRITLFIGGRSDSASSSIINRQMNPFAFLAVA